MFVDIKDPRIVQWIKEGKVFIYPTDTIYGIGCDATNKESVQRIREIKNSQKPFSVIAPNKDWINEYCDAGEELKKLPGSYTFIYKSTANVACNNGETLGVRIPNHPFSKLVEEANVPFVTTSVNKTGEKPIISPKDIPQEILRKIDIVVNAGIIEGNPSTIIDYTKKEPKTIRN